jgi:hypothetical protein
MASEIGPGIRGKIEVLMELIGAKSLGKQLGARMAERLMVAMKKGAPDMPPRAFEIVAETVEEIFEEGSEQLFEQLIPLYAKYYSEADIDALIAFYRTPTGRKVIETMPALTQESMQIGGGWAQALIPKAQETIHARFASEGLVEEPAESP